MGAYDDLLVDVPKAKGSYDDLLEPVVNPPSIKDRLYKTLNDVFQPGSVVKAPTDAQPLPVTNPVIPTRTDGVVDEIFNNARKPAELKPGARIVDGLPGVLEVGARKGYAGLGRIEAGALKALADVLGSNTLSDIAAGQQRFAGQIEDSAVLRGTPVEGFSNESIVQDIPAAGANAVSSVIQSLPALATGPAALPALFATTSAQEYGAGREQGLEPGGAALRALPMAALEVGGEKLGGFDKLADGLRAATRGGGVADLGNAMVASSLKELPSEELTTLGQFGVDKLPGIGTNQDATLDDLGTQLKDTALATILQSGGMGAGGSALKTIAERPLNVAPDPSTVPPVTPATVPAQDSTGILDALTAARELVNTPTQPVVEAPVVTEAPAPVEATAPGTYDDILQELPQGENANVPAEDSQIPAESVEAEIAEPQGSMPSDADRGIDVLQQPSGDTGADSAGAGQNNDDGAIAGRADAIEEGPAAPFEDASISTAAPVAAPVTDDAGRDNPTQQRVIDKQDALRAWLPDLDWATVGGRMVRDEADKVTRTTWEPKDYNFEVIRSALGTSYTYMQKAVQKALRGEKLGKKEQATVDALMDFHDEMMPSAADTWSLASQEEQDNLNQLLNDEAWHELIANNATTDDIANTISQYYETESNANTEAARADDGTERQAETTSEQSTGEGQAGIRETPERPPQQGGEPGESQPRTGTGSQSEPAISAPDEGIKRHVESLVKRRAAANQLGKSKQFDVALQLAKDLMNGEAVSPIKFKNAASAMKGDQQLADTLNDLHKIAKAPAKERKAVKTSLIDTYKQRIADADSAEALTALAKEIQADTNLSDQQAQDLDDVVFDAQDKYAEPDDEDEVSFSVAGQTSSPEFKNWFGNSKTVDDAGKPVVVYHGTSKPFSKVNMRKGAQGVFWVTSNKKAIEDGEIGAAGTGTILELYAKIENPAGWKEYDKYSLDELESRYGYDGVILPNSDGTFEAIVFNPNQIKSATKNKGGFSTENDNINLSSSAAPGGMTVAAVRSAIAKDIFNQEVDVYQSIDDAPDYIKTQAKSEGAEGVEGFYDGRTNRVALIANNLPNDKRAQAVARHELIGHYGLENMVGKELMQRLSARVLTAEKAGNKAIIDAAKLVDETQPGLSDYRRGKEIIAVMAERNLHNNIVKRVMDAIRKFLKEHGFTKEDITDVRIAQLLRDATEYLKAKEKGIADGDIADFSRAFHGTPHRFDKFSTDNIGTGEGAQAFGYGLYFASNKAIAESYRQNIPLNQVIKQFQRELPDDADFDEVMDLVGTGHFTKEQDRILKALDADGWLGFDYASQAISAAYRDIENYDPSQELRDAVNGSSQLYEVEIPNDNEYLLWDKPYKDQPKTVKEAIENAPKSVLQYGEDTTGENIYRRLQIPAIQKQAGMTPSYQTDKNASEYLNSLGISGIKYLDGSSRAKGDGNYNYVVFDDKKVNIEKTYFSNRKPVTVDNRDNWLFRRDELGRIQLAPTGNAYDLAATVTQNLSDKVGFGMASPELRKQIRHFKADMAKAMDVASGVAKTMNKMSPEERALVSDVVEQMVKTGVTPPDHVMKIAAAMSQTMDAQTSELVDLGMLAKDTAERWRGKYLPRFYNRDKDPALDTLGKKLLRTALPVRGLGGGSLKGRGLFQEVTVDELPAFEQLGWEVRDPLWKKDRQGRLELIDAEKARDTEKVVIWRDFSPEEREAMGENRDALFRFVMGYTAMQNDIALGRMFDAIAKNQEWTRSRASEGYTKIPDADIEGTGGVKRYGNLAGLYVRDDIIQHITQYEESGELLKFYRKALSFWKAGKTVLNPVSHMNNVVSNLTMAHFAGVSYWDTHKYIGALRDFVKGSKYLDEAKDVGLLTGDITRTELLANMPADIKALMGQQDSKITKTSQMTYKVLTFGLVRPMSAAYRFEDDFFKYLIYRDARENGASPDDAVDYATRYIFNYDDLPKTARNVRDAAIPFFAYTYKAVPALAHTLANYPWRFAAPALAIAGLNAIAYGLIAGDDDDDLAEKMAKGKELEAEERKNLPPWMQGKSALGTEKTIRLGNDPRTGLPLYWDVSRFIPGGDMFDINNQVEGTPLPAPIMPSNPVLTTIAAMLWNKDTFTGKDVVDTNDTGTEKAKKRGEWLIKQLSPAIAPTGYHADRLMQAGADMADTTIETPFKDYTGKGKDGLPVQAKYAIPQTLGIKVKPTDLELSADMAQGQDRKEIGTIRGEIRQAARLLDKGAISQRSYDETVAAAEEKMDRIINKE